MNLRNKLLLLFLVATLVPLGVTLWITTSLLEESLSYASTSELDEISQSLKQTGLEFYQRAREALKNDATVGKLAPQRYGAKDQANWPVQIQAFADSGDEERFLVTGDEGDRLNYLTRHGDDVWVYSRKLGGVGMNRLSRQIANARELVERWRVNDFRRGLTLTLIVVACAVWVVSLAVLVLLTYRIGRPIQELTGALTQLAGGDLSVRVAPRGTDEVGRAIEAFNNTAGQLEQSRERLIYLTRLEGWQMLARKMAHELKNSLTPIRLTMEEMVARGRDDDPFLTQAAQIVVDEVNGLVRRVRAFSEFSTEPPVEPRTLDLNVLFEERVAFLRGAHPEVSYDLRLANDHPTANADEDLIKGILTNLLENAAHAAGGGGVVMGKTFAAGGQAGFEVHDSGPGLSAGVRESLFEPTISFKKGGMGLGLSIARRGALLSGGDISLVKGELGGAAFRVVLPTDNGVEAHSHS